MLSIKEILDLLMSAWRWTQRLRNPARGQAARVLRVFESHGIQATQINRHLPEELRLLAIQWSSPDHLKEVLTQRHIDWINDFFALDPLWLEGEAASPHRHIPSYKDPRSLFRWMADLNSTGELGCFKVYLLMGNGAEISHLTQGDFAVVLEQFATTENGPSQYFHLAQGGHFSHPPCVLHLMQILAIAHVNGAVMQRSILGSKDLISLANNVGMIPDALAKSRRHSLAADHELWGHYSGSSPWLENLRTETEKSLMGAGMQTVVSKLQADRVRWARK